MKITSCPFIVSFWFKIHPCIWPLLDRIVSKCSCSHNLSASGYYLNFLPVSLLADLLLNVTIIIRTYIVMYWLFIYSGWKSSKRIGINYFEAATRSRPSTRFVNSTIETWSCQNWVCKVKSLLWVGWPIQMRIHTCETRWTKSLVYGFLHWQHNIF